MPAAPCHISCPGRGSAADVLVSVCVWGGGGGGEEVERGGATSWGRGACMLHASLGRAACCRGNEEGDRPGCLCAPPPLPPPPYYKASERRAHGRWTQAPALPQLGIQPLPFSLHAIGAPPSCRGAFTLLLLSEPHSVRAPTSACRSPAVRIPLFPPCRRLAHPWLRPERRRPRPAPRQAPPPPRLPFIVRLGRSHHAAGLPTCGCASRHPPAPPTCRACPGLAGLEGAMPTGGTRPQWQRPRHHSEALGTWFLRYTRVQSRPR